MQFEEHLFKKTSPKVFLIDFLRPQRKTVSLAYQSERPVRMNLILKQFPEKVLQGLEDHL